MKKIITLITFFGVMALLCCGLSACKSKEKDVQKREKIIVAKLKVKSMPLYFNGTLKPIKVIPVTSPVDGRVSALSFQYGEDVNKNQDLVTINSTVLAKEFRTTATTYLQKKDAFDNAKESFQGTEGLYKARVVSREAFLTARSQFQNTALSFLQAKFQLEKTLKKVNIAPATVEGLTLADTEAVNKLLRRRFSHIVVKAPGAGVALFPAAQSSGSSDSKCSILQVGCEVKSGGLLLTIGDLQGLSVVVQVSEININRIKKGMRAVITGDAFPGIKLVGEVVSVASQATPSQAGGNGGGGLSTFTINVKIPKITAIERKIIHVGMTAKITLEIKDPARIMIPLKAVQVEKGQSVVTIVLPSGQRKKVPVQTGTTTPEGNVSIISGIKPGDKVVLYD